jgi:hypothetical protein
VKGTLLAGAALLGALITVAHAQPSDPRKRDGGYIGKEIPVLEIDECPARDDMTPEEVQRVGYEHFSRGEILYAQGDYGGAVKELVAAYCIQPFYSMLKDIGQAYERELDYEKAIAYFEKFVLSVPPDAKPMRPCDPPPAVERENVLARIQVLQKLRAKVRVNTDPDQAKITLIDYQGVIAARGKTGDELAILAGHYDVLVEHEGFVSTQSQIDVEIGKPYTIFTKLEPEKGGLRVRIVPADARLFLQYPSGDKLQVGTGAYEARLPGGRYRISGEASGRLTIGKDIDVLPGSDIPVSLDLPPEPQFGRRQLIVYTTLAGGFAGGSIAGASENATAVATGVLAGAGTGFFGAYYAVPHDIPLGTSSLTITSSLIGGTVVGGAAILATDKANVYFPGIGIGMIVGGGVGYYTGKRLHISPGDAAVINSGALWGTTTGLLFSGSFDANRVIGAGLALSGLGMGTLGGVLMTRYFDVSRGRAALIDVGGIVGVFIGLGIEGVVSSRQNAESNTERQTNYVLGGMATGLIVSGILTRNLDAPKIAITPSVARTQSGSTTIGVGGSF